MSTTTHTPGPWLRLDRPENASEDARILTHISNGAYIVCTLGSTCTDGSPTHSKNAALIAAAPDLLSALESCISELNQLAFLANDKLAHAAIEKGLAAIAKAKGGQP